MGHSDNNTDNTQNFGRFRKALLGASALCLLGATFSGTAIAQDDTTDETSVQDTVVVTAMRREQDIQEVPASVTNLSSVDLEKAQVSDVLDLQYQIPNISIATGTGTANSARIFLRGVGEDESRGAVDPAVGIYIDGIYMGRQVGSLMDLVDVERIEVLRGPQGTLYGRNTNGGAIKLVSVKPQFEDSGQIRTTVGNHGRLDFRATGNLQLGDNTAIRMTGFKRDRDGFWDLNPNGDFAGQGAEVGKLDVTAFRGALYHEFDNDWSVLFSADYASDKSDPVPDSAAPPNDVDNDVFTIEPAAGVTCSTATPATFQPQGCFTDYSNETKNVGYSLNVDGQIGDLSFASLTGYREMEDDLSTRIGFPYFQETDQDQFSQEFTFSSDYAGPFNFVAGVYYFQENVLLESTFVFAHSVDVETTSYSAFGQGILEVGDNGTLTAGLRYTDEEKDLDAANLVFGLTREDSQSFDNLSYTLKYDHQFTDDIMAYASYTTGFKSGGWSPDCFGGAACFLPVEEETLDSFEIGARTDLFNNMLRFNTSYFFNKYEGLQIGATVPGLGFTRFNVDETEIQGLEVEWTLNATDQFSVFGNLGILDAEYTSVTGDQARGLTNNGASCPGIDPSVDAEAIACALTLDLKNAPEYKGMIGAEYLIQGMGGEISLRGDIQYEDSSWSLVANNPAHALTDPSTLLNVRAGYTPDQGSWNAAVWVQNLTDEEYWRSTSASSFTAYASPPLTWGIDVGVSF